METNYSYSNISNFDISFTFNKKKVENISDGIIINNNKELKEKLPKNKIFKINSLVFNMEKRSKEIYTQYNCIYNEENNSLYLIFNTNDNFYKRFVNKYFRIFYFNRNRFFMLISFKI